MKTLTTANWKDEVAASELPVMVTFTADWCGACRNFHPILEALEQSQGSHVAFGTVDADCERDLLRQYDVRALPTIVLFKGGREITRTVGGRSEAWFAHWLAHHLKFAAPPGLYRAEHGDSEPIPEEK